MKEQAIGGQLAISSVCDLHVRESRQSQLYLVPDFRLNEHLIVVGTVVWVIEINNFAQVIGRQLDHRSDSGLVLYKAIAKSESPFGWK